MPHSSPFQLSRRPLHENLIRLLQLPLFKSFDRKFRMLLTLLACIQKIQKKESREAWPFGHQVILWKACILPRSVHRQRGRGFNRRFHRPGEIAPLNVGGGQVGDRCWIFNLGPAVLQKRGYAVPWMVYTLFILGFCMGISADSGNCRGQDFLPRVTVRLRSYAWDQQEHHWPN